MKKEKIKITESELKKIVTESVKKIISENLYNDNDVVYGKWNNYVHNLGASKILDIIVRNSKPEDLSRWIVLIDEDLNNDSYKEEDWQ